MKACQCKLKISEPKQNICSCPQALWLHFINVQQHEEKRESQDGNR